MSTKKLKMETWYLIIILLFINYQIVTIIFNDNVLLRYLRDLLLIIQIALTFLTARNAKKLKTTYGFFILWLLFLVIASIKTRNTTVSITFVRRYTFPIISMILAMLCKGFTEKDFKRFFRNILMFLSVLSVWGIIQAWILKDDFLLRLGYPIKSLSGTLRDSFYFGNLGIQRVVSTLSNSNVFALILGTTILITILNAKAVLKKRKDRSCLAIICLAYILTFSRANFLAMIVVGLFVAWRYIPKKIRRKMGYALMAAGVLFVIGIVSKNNYIVKILGWVQSTFSGSEASSATRVYIWREALNKVLTHPLGIGFGHVGAYAQIANVTDFVHAENSYLAIAIDLGIPYLLLFLSYLFSLIRSFKRTKSPYGRTSVAIIAYMMICFMFSNHIYDMEAVTYIFLMVGLFYNMTVFLRQKGFKGNGFLSNSV